MVPLALAGPLASGCADEPAGPPSPAAAALSFSAPDIRSLAVGDTIRLAVEVRDRLGQMVEEPAVIWSSQDPRVAVVGPEGVVTAVAPGTARITAAAGGTATDTVQLSVSDPQYAVLIALFASTGGNGWTSSDNWGDNGPLGNWYVETDSAGRVTGLDLSDDNLVGRIPPELGDLSHLKTLDLSSNALSGGVPGQLGRLAALEELRLGDNRLSGPLPLALAELRNLRTFGYEDTDLCVPTDDSFETWLESIPNHRGSAVECAPLSDRDILVAHYEATGGPEWEYSTNWLTDAPLEWWHGVSTDGVGRVVGLTLVGNELKGSIPGELGGFSKLEHLELRINELTGAIPKELGALTNLRTLSLKSNALVGSIPTEFGGLSNLETLDLSSNALMGPLPTPTRCHCNPRGPGIHWREMRD